MANQTVATSLNFDSATISGLAHGDDIAINGGILTLDSDTRWGQNAAVIGAVSISASLGGQFNIDATKVWWLPFDASTGTVPALGVQGVVNATGGTSGATGEFLGIWTELGTVPLTSGGAMPASGFVKFRTKTGTFLDDEVITFTSGATVTVNSATGGQRGWIEVVGESAQSITVPRLGAFNVTGDWFELGVTDGTDDQVLTYPTKTTCPALWIEDAPGSGVYEKWVNAGYRWNVASQTVSMDSRGKFFGGFQKAVNITNASAVVPMTDTTGMAVGMAVMANSGITAGTYIASIIANTSVTLSANATATAGVNMSFQSSRIELARRSTNPCGFKPASGCKIRIPNVIFSTATSAGSWNYEKVFTAASKWRLVTTSAGIVSIAYSDMSGLEISFTGAYSVDINHCSWGGNCTMAFSNVNLTVNLNDVAGGNDGFPAYQAISGVNLFNGMNISDCRLIRQEFGSANVATVSISDCFGVNVTNCSLEGFGTTTSNDRGSTSSRTILLSRCFDIFIDNVITIGGTINLATCSRAVIRNTKYVDRENGTTNSTQAISALDINSGSSDIVIDGFSGIGIANTHPYGNIVNIATGCSTVTVKNIGSPDAPYNCGSASASASIVSCAVSKEIYLYRIYVINTRSAALFTANTVFGLICDNVWGDGGDSQGITFCDFYARGCKWTTSTTGQASVYGFHWQDAFISATAGAIALHFNETLSNTLTQLAITAGTPKFTGGGQLAMPTIGDQFTAEMPYFVLGITSLANSAPTLTGTNPTYFNVEFQYDLGSGYNGTWLTLSAANLATVNTINPATGVKLKLRGTVITGNATNALTMIKINTVTDATSQKIQYPLAKDATILVTGILSDSRILIHNKTKDTVLYDAKVNGTSLTFEYYNGIEAEAGDQIDVYHAWYNAIDGSTAMKKGVVSGIASSLGASFFIQQELCPVYAAHSVTYSTTGLEVYNSGDFVKDGPTLQIDLDDDDNTWFAHRLFLWDKYQIWNFAGNLSFFTQVTAPDAGNLSIGALLLDNVKPTTAKQGDEINVYNDTSTLPVLNPTTGGGGLTMYSGGKILVTSTGGIAPTEAQIRAWVRQEIGADLAVIEDVLDLVAGS